MLCNREWNKAFLHWGHGKAMKLNKAIAIPAIALTAGLSLAACGSAKAPALGNNHTPTAPAGAPVATKTAHSAEPAPETATPAAVPKATVAQPAGQVPVLDVSADGYSGIKPAEIGFSGDGGYIITGIVWSSWGPNEADGTGTSNIQGCVPDCATGSETPYPDTIVLSDPQGGQFTQVSSTRDGTVRAGSTLLILGVEQNSPDAAPAAPALTDCGGGVYAGADTSCPFALNVTEGYTGPGADYAYSPATGLTYTMNCTLEGASTVVCTGADNAYVQWNGNAS
jgi:hypothetical protein